MSALEQEPVIPRDSVIAAHRILEKKNGNGHGSALGIPFGEWGDPQPLIVEQDPQQYPVDALPDGIAAAIREVIGFVQCPVSLAACSALSALSLAGQALADVRRADKLQGPSSLYLIAIAESGERKTKCDDFFMSALREWERQAQQDAIPRLAEVGATVEAWEAKREGIKNAIREAKKKGESTDDAEKSLKALAAERPAPGRRPQLLYCDSTPESTAWEISNPGGWPSGGFIVSEGGLLFGGHAMGAESLMRNLALLNSLWEGGRVPITRRSKDKSNFTAHGRLTMGIAVQPDVIRNFLEKTKGLVRGIGFLARFLIAWPESTQGTRLFKEPPAGWPALSGFHRRIEALLSTSTRTDERGELDPMMLNFSPEAKAVWVQFHDDVEKELAPDGDMASSRDIASKAADNVARIAALFHLYENGTDGNIEAPHTLAATRIVAWHLYEARRFLGELTLPKNLSDALRLDQFLMRHCRKNKTLTVPTRTAMQFGHFDKNTLADAVNELSEAGRVRLEQEGRKRFLIVNPALYGGGHGA